MENKVVIKFLPPEIKEFLDRGHSEDNSFAEYLFTSAEWDLSNGPKDELNPEKWVTKFVDHYGGEGEGDSYWTVISFENEIGIVYICLNGWYASYDGASYNDYELVEPVEKTVIQYERVRPESD